MRKLDQFTTAYVMCALWASTDNADESGGKPLDENYGVEDIAPETLAEMMADCKAFQGAHWDDIAGDLERAGRDFWLSRNGHGAGFFDGDWRRWDGKKWSNKLGDKLQAASKVYGSYDLYVGDDGRIYGS